MCEETGAALNTEPPTPTDMPTGPRSSDPGQRGVPEPHRTAVPTLGTEKTGLCWGLGDG